MYGKFLFILNISTFLNSVFAHNSNLSHYYIKAKFENSTSLYFEPIEKIIFFEKVSYLISYLDKYKIFNLQNSLFSIYENAIHFCKTDQKNINCIRNYSNRRFNSQKFKKGNSIEKIQYLCNDIKIIIPKFLSNSIKDDFELEEDITNISQGAKNN